MASEAIYIYASTFTLQDSTSGSVANAAFASAGTASLGSAAHLDYPEADFVLTCSFAASIAAAGLYVNLYRQDLLMDGSVSALPPSSTYKQLLVGTFAVPSGQSASASYPCPDVPLANKCQFWIEDGSGQTIAAAWTLKCTPKTLGPKP